MRIPFSFIQSGVSVFDPASLSLEGWWRADFAASPWTGTASAGGSGARNLTEATNPPAVGAAQNGKNPADFDGTNDLLGSATTFTTFAAAAAGSIWCLFYADTSAADAGAGSRHDNEGLVAEEGGATALNLTFSAGGVSVSLYDGAFKEVITACGTGAYHLAQAKWNSTNLYLRIDSGSWVSIAAGALSGSAGGLVVGRNYDTKFLDGRILDVGMATSALSDGSFDSVKSYVNSRFALAL
jgi:hypothetical protein